MRERNTLGALGLLCAVFLPIGCAGEHDGNANGEGTSSVPQSFVKPKMRPGMSAMGGAAKQARLASVRAATAAHGGALAAGSHTLRFDTGPDDGGDDDEGGYTEGPAGGQAETSIAVDASGQHIVVGFNDTRGFFNPVTSVSGFSYSDDGGKTFVDGGQLPTPGDFTLAGTRYPQVFGDPDIKYLGGCNFVYSSILVSKFNDNAVVQGMGIHRSRDCGHTWEGPFTIPASNNPTGKTETSGGVVSPVDAADKEYLDVDPDTGRVIIGWSNFTDGGEQLSVAYSDDVLTAAVPTWSKQIVVGGALDEFDQSAIPRFAGNGSKNVYAAWSIRQIATDPTGLLVSVGVARSLDNGATWQPPVTIATPFKGMDQVLGNDRVHDFPGMAVDTSRGKHRGNLYIAYANNDNDDGSDIAFQRSTDGGATFSAPALLNSRPGHDRAQWFPWVSVDKDTGRVHVFYYDQGLDTTGDLTEASETFSDDGGVTWSRPRPLSARPFKAGWGNDTGQPNIGDYIQGVSQHGELFAEFAATSPVGFADGQPNLVFPSFPTPDVSLARVGRRAEDEAVGGVELGGPSFREISANTNGFLDPDDFALFDFPVFNSVTNPLNSETLREVTGELRSATPGVLIFNRVASYPDLAPGATAKGFAPFVVRLGHDFVPGTPIEFTLDVRRRGTQVGRLFFTQQTGTPKSTVVFAENFDAASAGALPAGWRNLHQGGANVVPWTTSASFCGASSPAAFHQEAEDGPVPGTATRFERLVSPNIVIPSDSEYVLLDYDVCYDLEDDPNFSIQAFDGLVARFFDITAGRYRGPSTTDPGRNVLAEAFETEFTTGGFKHYPKHLPRSGDVSYFQDMSAWSGDSGGVRHVHQRLPGMQGSTFQLRFEYTQDLAGTCANVRPGHACGASVDNIVLRSVKSVVPAR